MEDQGPAAALRLGDTIRLSGDKILNPSSLTLQGRITPESVALVVLAAGKGTRFGRDPKCIQPVSGSPLARHSIDAFRRFGPGPVICIVGYRHEDVSAALGDDNTYVRSDDPAGGTGFAALEAFSVPGLLDGNPLVVIAMGDRIVPPSVFRHLCDTHRGETAEADLTFLSAEYEPPRNLGKGRVVRDENGQVVRIVEERDIRDGQDGVSRHSLLELTEGNCPLYVIRAAALERHLRDLTNANAQGQYYLTDLVEMISLEGGVIRTVVTTAADPEYDLLCADVNQPLDLALLEGVLASAPGLLFPEDLELADAARAIAAGRPAGQVASIARQLEELVVAAHREKLAFDPGRPVGIGISGGRLRIAFMHPDMVRFYGPAWQMPIGAGDEAGEEQIVMLVQSADDGRIHLFPIDPQYRESVNHIPADHDVLYPGEEISDLHAYEQFGTHMSETLLLSLGYFSDEELEARRTRGDPLPPPSLWVGGNMRRPFALVDNAIASLRTLRAGNLGSRVQECLGRDNFRGLLLASTGSIPQGGFSSSSAVTVATQNAMNALYDLAIPADLLVHLACQAEYGTGVRAGSLDQATEQKGRAGQGTLISSNPRDNYRVLGTYLVPADRFQILFPYAVERDRSAWRWSWGAYAETAGAGPLTTSETRKMTGKAAELAAVLVRLPFSTDFFKRIEDDLVSGGGLGQESRAWIASILRGVPVLAGQEELRQQALERRGWYIEQIVETEHLDLGMASRKADVALASVFAGWRDPVLRRTLPDGSIVTETGVPLRAMLAYLFGEVATNFRLIHQPDAWISCVTQSQKGDRSVSIDPERLPTREEMRAEIDWERGCSGPERLDLWLHRFGATPFDYNRGLDDATLSTGEPPEFDRLDGSNFFRGLALIDLAEAMLKRAFGNAAVAVRVNAAGQGDYFQVHVDTEAASPAEVREFISAAFYRRFGLSPDPEFVEMRPGGGASGTRLSRYDSLPQLVRRLRSNGLSQVSSRAGI